MLKVQCPHCGKGEKSEVIEILPERRYMLRCGDCKRAYIFMASLDAGEY